MKKITIITLTIITLSMIIIGSTQALTLNHTVDYWFADPITNAVINSITLNQNTNFDLAVWVKSDSAFTAKSAELYVSYGSTILNLNAPAAGFINTATFATANSNTVDAAGADIVWSDVTGKQISGGMKLGVLNLQNLVVPGNSTIISIVTHPTATGASTLNKSSWLYGGTATIGYLNEATNTVFTVNTPAAIPEPGTFAGMGTFLLGFAAFFRRKK